MGMRVAPLELSNHSFDNRAEWVQNQDHTLCRELLSSLLGRR